MRHITNKRTLTNHGYSESVQPPEPHGVDVFPELPYELHHLQEELSETEIVAKSQHDSPNVMYK